MSMASVAFRDPLIAAKHLATIDVLNKHSPASCLCSQKQPARSLYGKRHPYRAGGRENEVLELIQKLWQ